MLNKNNVKVKLADGLTEMGISQVKQEIGGGSGSDGVLKLYCEENELNGDYYLVRPNGEKYVEEGQTVTLDDTQVILDQICTDYGLEVFESGTGVEDPYTLLFSREFTHGDFIRSVKLQSQEVETSFLTSNPCGNMFYVHIQGEGDEVTIFALEDATRERS